MAEYIEREEVREAFRMEFDNAYADDITDRLPTADVQEVVRCKDCYWSKPWNTRLSLCNNFNPVMKPDDFCSCDEKRSEQK